MKNKNIKSFNSFINKVEKIKENKEEENYMFFANIEHICRMMQDIKDMPKEEVDSLLSEHDWASDHISRSFESISHVYHFLKATLNGEEYELPEGLMEEVDHSSPDLEHEFLNKRNSEIISNKLEPINYTHNKETVEIKPIITLEPNYILYDIKEKNNTLFSLEITQHVGDKLNQFYYKAHFYENNFINKIEDTNEFVAQVEFFLKEATNYVPFLLQKHINQIINYISSSVKNNEDYINDSIILR
jgi:hypothetical protein